MIKVELQKTHPDGYAQIRDAHLAKIQAKEEVKFELANNYRKVLYKQYNNTCAYLATTFDAEEVRLNRSIDHFKPQKACPECMYDWDNFRLCDGKLNRTFPDGWPKKGEEVLDPCAEDFDSNWFYLDVATGSYLPSSHVPTDKLDLVSSTCIYLNKHDYPSWRLRIIWSYLSGLWSKEHINRFYPGIYYALTGFPA